MTARPATRRRRHVGSGLVTLAASLVVGALLTGLAPAAHAETPEQCPAGLRLDGLSALGHLNSLRARHGLRSLSESPDLMGIAAAHSAAMARAGYVFHNPSLTAEVPNWEVLGENVGSGPSVQAVDACFDWSSKHYANEIGSAYTQVGIGTATGKGGVYVTVDFRKPLYATPAPVEVKVPVHKPAPKPVPKPLSVARGALRVTHRPSASDRRATAQLAALRAAAARRAAAAQAQQARVTAVRASAAADATGAGSDPVGRALDFSRTLTAMAG